jgi:hypothetical protein
MKVTSSLGAPQLLHGANVACRNRGHEDLARCVHALDGRDLLSRLSAESLVRTGIAPQDGVFPDLLRRQNGRGLEVMFQVHGPESRLRGADLGCPIEKAPQRHGAPGKLLIEFCLLRDQFLAERDGLDSHRVL